MFYCGGANARFSGVVMYSTLEDGGYTLCVDRYHEGAIAVRRDVYSANNTGADNAKAMAALVGAAKVVKKAAVRTKAEGGSLYGGYTIEEVVVVAPKPETKDDRWFWNELSHSGGGGIDLPPIGGGGGGGSYSGGGGGTNGNSGSTSSAILPNKHLTYTASQYQNTGGYRESCDCMCVTQKIMWQMLGSNANIGSNATKIQLYLENPNGDLYRVGDAGNVFNVLNSHLDNGHPIITGVNHFPKKGINEGATDHFIVIVGRGYDSSRGQYYYNYVETARGPGNGANAISDSNRLYYDTSNYTFQTDSSVAYRDKTYTITQIRPNK